MSHANGARFVVTIQKNASNAKIVSSGDMVLKRQSIAKLTKRKR